jgi:protein required for attachment to host cells
MNNTLWILVADSCEAKVFATEKVNDDWRLIKEFHHTEGHKKDIDLVSDKSGNFPNISRGSSSFSEPTDPKEAEAELFARHLAEELRLAHARNEFHRLVVVAPPRFHGLLKKSCESHVLKLIIKHLEKDYTKVKQYELIPLLRDQISVGN